jgi:hypothetical protein
MHLDDDRTVFLTSDLARLIERSAATVRAETARRRLRASLRTPGGVHVYTREDIEQYLAERAARRGVPS